MKSRIQPTLLQPENLVDQLTEWDGKILDCRGPSEYQKSHIPGALSVPTNLLQDPESERGELYSWEKIRTLLTDWGVGSKGPWLLYDDSGFVPAGRLFWVLEYLGVSGISILDGGWMTWCQKKYPVTQEQKKLLPGNFDTPVDSRVIANKEQVVTVIQPGKNRELTTILVDTRTEEEYLGIKVTAQRNGHIPGAIHINWEENIVDLFHPKFKDFKILNQLYEEQGVTPDKEVIVYCRTGSRSCQTYLTLRLLGYKKVRNYLGSWLDWGNDPQVPVE